MLFSRRNWTIKPPVGTQLVRGHGAPNCLAIPFNETAGQQWLDYANKPSLLKPSSGAVVNAATISAGTFSIVSGPNGPMASALSTSSYLTCGFNDYCVPTGPTSVMVGFRKRDATVRASAIFGLSNAFLPDNTRCGSHCPYSDGVIYWDFAGQDASHRLSVSGISAAGYNVWCFTTGLRGQEIWKNGTLRASNANNNTRVTGTEQYEFLINSGNGLTTADLIDLDFLYVWDYQIEASQVQALNAYPFSVFEPYDPRGIGFSIGAAATRTASDQIVLSDSTSLCLALLVALSDQLVLSDAVSLSNNNKLTLSDQVVLSDSILVGLGLLESLTDTITLSDVLKVVLGDNYTLADTLTLTDSIRVWLGLNAIVGDSLNSWSDLVSRQIILKKVLSDFLSLSDGIILFKSGLTSLSDALTLSDTARVVLGLAIRVADTLTMADLISTNNATRITIALSDTMSMFDLLNTVSASTATTRYIREYLNDAPINPSPDAAITETSSADATKQTRRDYLRRYLNDVS